MTIQNSPELFWLALSTLAVSLFWVPHILQLIMQEGLYKAVHDPSRSVEHKAEWAQRARRAHCNSVENIAVFAPLVLLLVITNSATSLTALAAMVFFYARLGHFITYAFGIPFLRVVLFLVGWLCQMVLALALFGLI